MSRKNSTKKVDKAAIAMVCFGIILCAFSLFFQRYWILLLGITWIALPLFFTEETHHDDFDTDPPPD
ncbi:hypothetical protein [Filimonas effusa]|uniref:Uncharacterized protein n=1 Tax=Filimonas effusa TaxID=2508721 RepID=A0A4Q1D3F5_9BACT|nr:hypothetical protein [Filimonas effusa]RXK82950.1 hypothetical protein ESB13_12545 [Filimonas effusa]